jgi:YedE family putative selenium metabolism protein
MKEKITGFFASRWGIILTGGLIGFLGAYLQKNGNPKNMGICVACFERDIAGALGLHRTNVVQYIRPEIIGFVLAFLGCPWRASFRLAGGDFTAIPGLLGLAGGIAIGVAFLKSGYNLGRSSRTYPVVGAILPALMVGLLLMLVVKPVFSEGGPIFFSESGPGSMHAPLLISLGAGLLIGFLAQRTRFCTMGAVRDVILMKDFHLMSGLGALIIGAFLTNLAFGQFNPGYTGQPVAHSSLLWNILGMLLAGMAYALAGGCPGRQLFLSGEGDADSAIFVLGMISGAAFSHNFGLAGKPDSVVDGVLQVGGISQNGMIAVLLGIAVCLVIGFSMREKDEKGAE